MKRWLLMTAALLVLGPIQAFGAAADDEPSGSIVGLVVNGTDEGGGVANLEVVLQGVRHGAEATMLPPQVTRTDAEGSFSFDGLTVSEQNSYLVFVTHGGVEYGSRDIKLTSEASTVELEMEVYESTTSDDAIRVTLNHIVLKPDAEAQMLHVLEVFEVVNDGDRAYIGEDENTGRQPTIQFSLPEGAVQVEVLSGLALQDLVGTATGFADTTPFPPGKREVTPTYSIPYSETDLLFQKTLPYPTDRLTILLRDEGATLEGQMLSAAEPTEMGGERYLMLTGDSFPADAPIEFWLRGLPTSKSGENGPDILLPLLGVGLALALGIAVLYPRLRRRLGRRQDSDEQPSATGD